MALQVAGIATVAQRILDALRTAHGEVEKLWVFESTCNDLLDRLEKLFGELKEIEKSGGLESKAVDQYVKALEEYSGQLQAYNKKSPLSQFLYYSKLTSVVKRTNKTIDELVQTVGLAHFGLGANWKKKYDADMDELRHKFSAFAENQERMLHELHTMQDKLDAVIQLMSANKVVFVLGNDMITRMLTAVTHDSPTLASLNLPDWFISENEVTFDEVPFAHSSFTTVHRGEYKGSLVAVKMLLPGDGRLDTTLQSAFAHELDIWKRLDHPRVAHLIGACHISSRPFLVSDYATNGNMREFLDRSADRQVMWRLLCEAAQGLSHLHEENVVHGDIRLIKILVTKEKSALLSGFCVSHVKSKDKSKSKSMITRKDGAPTVVGTWRWKAPEAFDCDEPHYELDVYSLGMCIFEAFVGQPPYADVKDEGQGKAMILAGKLPTRPADMPDKVWTLISRMTTKERTDRMPLKDVIKSLGEL